MWVGLISQAQANEFLTLILKTIRTIFWRFSSLSYVGYYLIRYWISNTLTSEKISNIMISDIVSVLPIPLLKSVEPNLLGIDAYSVYFPVRLFGENLKTDFTIVWFGNDAGTTFSK